MLLMGFNYWIDPLWNFSHKHNYNDYQIGFDERQQKTNYINSRDFDYDSLMIGTSRVTYMNENTFKDEKVFNYSLSNLHIDEYLSYINYAKKKNGKDFDMIYMELYQNSYNAEMKNTGRPASVYIDKAEDPMYKYKTLFSYKTLQSSLNNYEASSMNEYKGPRSYNRDNVAQTTYPNDRLPAISENFKASFKKKENKPFVYSEKYKNRLIQIKDANPNTKFVIFTDPIYQSRFELIMGNSEQRKAYERWFKDMVDVFGEVYSFHGETPLTTNPENYFDLFHYYPSVGDKMINAMQSPETHKDIVTIVNKDNIDQYLDSL